MPQQKELQGGGRSGNLKVSSLSPPHLLFFYCEEMTTMSLLSYFVSFHYCEKDNDNTIVVSSFFLFLLRRNIVFSQHNTILLGLGKQQY